jgi:hypothetical protein
VTSTSPETIAKSGRETYARIIVWLLIAASWVLVFTRSIPLRSGDRGIFVSMAERVAAGDTLYVDVWDNKEPFFFLTLGAGRMISPFMDVALELIWIAACAIAMYAVLRAFKVPTLMSSLVGLGLVPVIITGAVYYAGFSHLPPTALLLLCYAFLVRGRLALAGAVIPLIAVFKIIMVPMAVVLIVVYLLNKKSWRDLKPVAIGFVVSGALITALLVIRGEFVGYVKLVMSNIGYSQSSISDAYQVPILKHIEPVFGSATSTTVAAIIVILALVAVLRRDSARDLWWSTLASLVTAFGIIVLTGLWPHHGQIFYGPAALALVLLVVGFHEVATPRAGTIILVLATAFILAGAPSLRTLIDSGLSVRTRLTDLTRISAPAQDLLAIASSGTYERLGKNTDDSHAMGLENFQASCYQFVQYTYDLPATLDYIPGCLPSVDYLLVDSGLVPQPDADNWNRFVDRSEAAIAQDFTCEPKSWGRLCVNKALSQAAG